jgi:transcription-repair coupling factor (superfamily II helicase)
LDYCGDVHERLVIYKRLANCDEESQLEDLREELIDRFGLLPDSTQLLLECHRIRLSARRLGIRKVDANGESIRMQFDKSTTLDPTDLIMMLSTHPNWRLDGQDRIRILQSGAEPLARAAQTKGIMKELSHCLRN